mmetsp:Transcript_77568/g.207240  ORF Transcript_77568/g.207240 Transcript_77568/m.207240 type:complete len:548 (-) Transcript_77568:104-1747(-)
MSALDCSGGDWDRLHRLWQLESVSLEAASFALLLLTLNEECVADLREFGKHAVRRPQDCCLHGVVAAVVMLAAYQCATGQLTDAVAAIDIAVAVPAGIWVWPSRWALSWTTAASFRHQLVGSGACSQLQHPVPKLNLACRGLSAHSPASVAPAANVAIFGAHASLVGEAITAARSIAGDPQMRVFMPRCPDSNFIHRHHCNLQCELLGQCGGNAPSGAVDVYRSFIELWVRDVFETNTGARLHLYAALFEEMLASDRGIIESDFVVCLAVITCILLHASSFRVPLVSYNGLRLLDNTGDQTTNFWMLLHFRSIANSAVPVAVHNDFLRVQVELQFGLSLDAVRPMSLYTQQRIQEPGSVLVLRSPWLHRCDFLQWFATFLAIEGYASHFHVLGRPPADFLSFARIASYSGAVLLPWDPALMSFYELYHSGVPLAVPVGHLIELIHRDVGWVYTDPIGNVSLGRPRLWWTKDETDPFTIQWWWQCSDSAWWPGVFHFKDLRELATWMANSESRLRQRAAAVEFSQKARNSSAVWWRSAVSRAISNFVS